MRERSGGSVDVLLRYTFRVAGPKSFDRLHQTIIDIASGEEDTMIAAEESYYQQALREGRAQGLRQSLEQLLAQRFGPLGDDVRTRLGGAALATLERWFGRALTATSLDDALAGE